jgi:cytochrome b561
MRLTNSPERFGLLAMTLHWVIAVALVYMLWLGNHIAEDDAYELFPLHKSLGITILGLSLLRLALRFIDPPPPLPEHMVWWERLAAYGAHIAFYGLMIGLPLSGWAMNTAAADGGALKTSIWGWFDLPALPGVELIGTGKKTARSIGEAHETLAMVTWILLALHVLAALKHHIWDRDTVLTRMLPFIPALRRRG